MKWDRNKYAPSERPKGDGELWVCSEGLQEEELPPSESASHRAWPTTKLESFFGCLLRSSQRLGIMIQKCTERRRAHEKSGIFKMHDLLALLT